MLEVYVYVTRGSKILACFFRQRAEMPLTIDPQQKYDKYTPSTCCVAHILV